MKSAREEEMIARLSALGYRITKARTEILKKLAQQEQPTSIQELCSSLKGVDEVSIYRTVRTLLDEELLEEVRIAGEVTKYALSHGHHHHAVCTHCGFVEHIECKEKQRTAHIPTSFRTIDTHETTLYGVCKKCA